MRSACGRSRGPRPKIHENRFARAREALPGFLEIPQPRSFIHLSATRVIDRSITRSYILLEDAREISLALVIVRSDTCASATAASANSRHRDIFHEDVFIELDRPSRIRQYTLDETGSTAGATVCKLANFSGRNILTRHNLAGCRRFRARARILCPPLSLSLSLSLWLSLPRVAPQGLSCSLNISAR